MPKMRINKLNQPFANITNPMNLIILIMWCSLLLSGCFTQPRIIQIRQLSEVPQSEQIGESNGSITGLTETSADGYGIFNTNILIVHGIGWTESFETPPFAFDFINSIKNFYGAARVTVKYSSVCQRSSFKLRSVSATGDALTSVPTGGLQIFSNVLRDGVVGDDPKSLLKSTRVGCLDKIIVSVAEKGTFNLYRLLLDDDLYNAYQYPHIGYDDFGHRWASPSDQYIDPEAGYQNLAKQRASLNGAYKDNLINYGFSDALMYLGPVGGIMRNAFHGAICAATSETNHQEEYFSSKTAEAKSVDALCLTKVDPKHRLFMLAESFGSRMVFDALTQDVDPRIVQRLNITNPAGVEVFLQANQIPLMALGRLHPSINIIRSSISNLKFVALSEINDLLSYELVPYFEHLYNLRCREGKNVLVFDCLKDKLEDRQAVLLSPRHRDERISLIRELGFDVVDVRLSFASPIFHVFPLLIDPNESHTRHLEVPVVQQIIFCGAKDGRVKGSIHNCAVSQTN